MRLPAISWPKIARASSAPSRIGPPGRGTANIRTPRACFPWRCLPHRSSLMAPRPYLRSLRHSRRTLESGRSPQCGPDSTSAETHSILRLHPPRRVLFDPMAPKFFREIDRQWLAGCGFDHNSDDNCFTAVVISDCRRRRRLAENELQD
jgi:hypothetical protein